MNLTLQKAELVSKNQTTISEKAKNCLMCTNKSRCFKKLNPKELESINNNRAELHYHKGEVIAKQGIFYTHVLYIQAGLVKVYREMPDRSNVILNFFMKGNLLGLPFLFENGPLDYSVSAIEDTVICAIDRQLFEKMIRNNGHFAVSMVKELNQCALFSYDRIIGLNYKQINGRFADTLLYLSQKIYSKNEFTLTLSRKDLAEYTGVSVMSIIRVIKEFKKDGVMNIQGNHIEIIKPDVLIQISKTG
jgi:CRP/FNR family transcriptional regulator